MASGAILFYWLQDSYNSAATKEVIWENISWTSYQNLNISKYDDLSLIAPYVTSGRLDSLQLFTEITLDLLIEHIDLSAAKLGVITGLLYVILNSKSHLFKLLQQSKFQYWLQAMVFRSLFVAVCLILAIIVAPFIGVFIAVLMCYRKMVHFYLKMTKSQYVQLFDGLDAIWAVEEDTSRSIINVLMFIEVEDVEEGSNLINTFRKIIMNCLATPPLPCAKIFYLRRQYLGYFYWEQQTDLIIEDYIRPMLIIPPNYKPTKCNSSEFPHRISEDTLKNIVGELSNTMLPKDHAACWEILVGSQPIKKSSPDSLESKRLQYPIMFRIHHSLGDGIALIQLLVSLITDIPTPSASPDNTYMHSSRPVRIPMLTRKFQLSNNSKRNTLHMEECCNIGENSIHQIQSPIGLNITRVKMSDKRYSEGHCKANDTSINFQSIQENTTVMFHNNNKKNEPEIILSSSLPVQSQIKTNSVTTKCKQRPLFLSNCSASVGELAKSSFHEQFLCKSERNTRANSYQISSSTPQPTSEFKTFPDCYSKIFGSYNKPLTTISTEKLSPSLNSNFQTSLPMLNLCKTSESQSVVHQFSQNTNKLHDSENYFTDSLQNTRCQSPIQIKMSLEEPPSLFKKTKSASFCAIPKSTFELATLSKIPCSKSMTLHCYNHTMSDSYITIPEDIACSAIEPSGKQTNTSTTIYYYPSPTKSLNPTSPNNQSTKKVIQTLTNDTEMTLQKSIHYNKNVSSVSSLINCESNFLDSISKETNVTVAQTIHHGSIAFRSSPLLSLNSTSIKTDKCTFQDMNCFDWDTNECESTIENRTTKSDEVLKRMSKSYTLEIQSTAIKNPTHEDDHTKKTSTLGNNVESPMIKNNQYDYSLYTKKETEITLDNHKGHGFRRLKSERNKLWDQSECKDTNNPESEPPPKSDDPNRYIQQLNTINNSMGSLKKPERFSQFFKIIGALSLSPASLIHQAIMKVTDRNVLHGPPLTGYKVIAWHRDINGELFDCIKKLKSCLNARFTDVFLTALSASLETYFETHQVSYDDGIPDSVNVVIPARMEQSKYYTTAKKINMTMKDRRHSSSSQEGITKSSTNKPNNFSEDNTTTFDLNNRFSVAMLQLPVSQALLHNNQGNKDNKFSPSRRLAAVCHNSELLRKSLDYQINYWLLKVVATYLTKTMISTVVNSSQSTLVVSNMMGPIQQLSFAGSKLKDIIFWVPHRGTTGIGISVLSYMGHLQIGIMADRAVIHCKEDAQMILDEIIVQMSRLDAARSTQEIVVG